MTAAEQPAGGRRAVGLYRLDDGKHAHEYLAALRRTLGDVSEPDELGVFEARVEAGSHEEALQRVFDAIAATGADDHVAFMEHPDVPRHWQRVNHPGAEHTTG